MAWSSPWTSKEDSMLAEGFIERGLWWESLRAWMEVHGFPRGVDEIARRLILLNYFSRKVEPVKQRPLSNKKNRVRLREAAVRDLEHEIQLARVAAPVTPPYKNAKEWERL